MKVEIITCVNSRTHRDTMPTLSSHFPLADDNCLCVQWNHRLHPQFHFLGFQFPSLQIVTGKLQK
jgi:hypothetical protein